MTDQNNGNGTQYYQAPQGQYNDPNAQNQQYPQYQQGYQGQPGPGGQNYVPPNQYEELPEGVRGWNWGAFMFTFFWGIGNRAYLSFLALVPILNIVWPFICGGLGNKWAWQSGYFKDVETFRMVQSTWNRAGLLSFIICVAMVVFYLIIGATLMAVLIPLIEQGF